MLEENASKRSYVYSICILLGPLYRWVQVGLSSFGPMVIPHGAPKFLYALNLFNDKII